MRNSIQGPLLRTGNNSSFKALGETGYPVFKMAFQLREAIYRLDAGRDLARHLAVPQNDQGGDRTDWYSSFPGDVIPWSGASEAEQASARQQFEEFQVAVQALSEQMLNADQTGAGGDRRVFAQLLKSVVHFPDYDFVYLVNGVLVITFWGFVHPTGVQSNPMHWLQSSSVAAATPSAASAAQPETPPRTSWVQNAPAVETVTPVRRWNWRWLLWLLLALLCLALLLGLLRGCAPSLSLPGLPWISADKNQSLPTVEVGNGKVPEVTLPAGNSVNAPKVATENNETVGTTTAAPDASSLVPETPSSAAPAEAPVLDASPRSGEAQNAPAGEDATAAVPPVDAVPPMVQEPTVSEAQNHDAQPHDVAPHTQPPVIPAQGEPLIIPPSVSDGPAQFLNGQWRVNGGIQDKLTGRPLQLQYNFNQGNGTVSVRQSSGVTCTGAAMGNVEKGALNISNPEQMKCSDGSNFIGPTIACKSPASGHADCVGSNDGDKTFPIRMLQPNT
ncbi:hypothetical protein KXR87_12585 [Yokenella regensburgei]|uniref:SrfA family protein n=1 Tax=Yokenella regensburgei TaxID=158877 RepID=UPI003F17EFA4